MSLQMVELKRNSLDKKENLDVFLNNFASHDDNIIINFVNFFKNSYRMLNFNFAWILSSIQD